MIKKIMLSALAITVVCVMIWHNLVSNSVYYAKYMPHKEGSEPVLVMIMDNFDFIYKPMYDKLQYRSKINHII